MTRTRLCVQVCVRARQPTPPSPCSPQNKPAEPEHLALAVHVLNVGMVVSVYRGVLNLLSMSSGHLHTLYTFTQRVSVGGLVHTHTLSGCLTVADWVIQLPVCEVILLTK